MNVLLINTNRERAPQTLIPLGVCCVASAAKAAGHDVRLLDLTFERSAKKALSQAVAHFWPDAVGLSVRNIDNCDPARPKFYLAQVRDLIAVCRESGARNIVIGGPAVTTAPEAALRYLAADFAIVGEGEASFPALLGAIERDQDPTGVPGVIVIRDGRAVGGAPAPSTDLSSFPPAAVQDWLDIPRYRSCDAPMPVQTKRGCAFDCSYCVYPRIEGAGIRLREPGLVACEVAQAAKLGFRSAEFVDSVFNVPEDHAASCCEAICRLSARVPLQTLEVNPAACSSGLVKAMNAAGFAAVGCTAESGSDVILASLRKGFDSVALGAAVRQLRKLDALRLWIFMLGAPGETESTVRQTARFMEKSLPDRDLVYLSCGLRILPGTELQERAAAEGVISSDDDLLAPAFYFSPHLTPEKAMSIVAGSGFPSANIVSLADGNNAFLPVAQRLAHLVGISPPYWRWLPVWNRTRWLWPPSRRRRERALC